jgi:hypothetical protein
LLSLGGEWKCEERILVRIESRVSLLAFRFRPSLQRCILLYFVKANIIILHKARILETHTYVLSFDCAKMAFLLKLLQVIAKN